MTLVERLRYRGDAGSEEAAERIEELERENFALKTKLFTNGLQVQFDDMRDRITELEAENMRLREALKNIADENYADDDSLRGIASAALEGSEGK